VLVAVWSPKGGSGSSVFSAGCALSLARTGPARIVDLGGDQPSVLGLPTDPELGVREWLAIGVAAPVEALERLEIAITPGLRLLPAGRTDIVDALPEAGAALAVALRTPPNSHTVLDVGTASDPVCRALLEVADVNVLVVRGCYLALRRAVHAVTDVRPTGVVVLEEQHRALRARDVGDVLGAPVIARVPVHPAIARAVDAGVLVAREPERLLAPARLALTRLTVIESGRAA
jgi:MinD superfamily P-loop ATPase